MYSLTSEKRATSDWPEIVQSVCVTEVPLYMHIVMCYGKIIM